MIRALILTGRSNLGYSSVRANVARSFTSKKSISDLELFTAFHDAVSGKGDGRISVADADGILEQLKESHGEYTDTRKDIVAYARKHYKWTEEADKKFRADVMLWAREVRKAANAKPLPEKKVPEKKVAVKKAPKEKK